MKINLSLTIPDDCAQAWQEATQGDEDLVMAIEDTVAHALETHGKRPDQVELYIEP